MNVFFNIIMLDFDYFKRINDDYGHDLVDKILTDVTVRSSAILRGRDCFARWGGEEFMEH